MVRDLNFEVKKLILDFKLAIKHREMEKEKQIKTEVIEKLKALGLSDELARYIVAIIERAEWLEKQNEEKREKLEQMQELIKKLYNLTK